MIERYLHGSDMLRAVFLLVDIRHKPSGNDKIMYDWITAQDYRPVIIATKLDKIKRSQTARQLKEIREGLGAPADTVMIPFSAKTKQGRDEIYALLSRLCSAEDTQRSE